MIDNKLNFFFKKQAWHIGGLILLFYVGCQLVDFEKMNEQSTSPGAERGIFLKLFETYNYLPITTDSHLGEYLPWAHSIADHYAILEFYKNYKRVIHFSNSFSNKIYKY